MTTTPTASETQKAVRVVAVIDIGATSIRMAIAQLLADDQIEVIDQLAQAVQLGSDVFSTGSIRRNTIEDCIHVLTTYRHKLDEYRIPLNENVRVVATSAVREASNSLAFQDRVYLATGFIIEPFDEAELHRATYLGIQSYLDRYASDDQVTLVYEIGGGSTEVLALQHENVLLAQAFRLGSLRLCVSLADYGSGIVATRDFLESQIEQALKRIRKALGSHIPKRLIAMGGEIRLAAAHLSRQSSPEPVARISVNRLRKLTDRVLNQSTDSVARDFHVNASMAELFGPALLAHCMLAELFGVEQLMVADVNLRDGLITEMAQRRVWTDRVQAQIFRWAINLGRKYQFDEAHALCVAHLAEQIFGQLAKLHQLEPRFGAILTLAALLHEIGLFIDSRGFHKHSMYLISNSEFFGIGAKDLQLVALVARYHRRATPQPSHEGYASLDRDNRVAVNKLASLLRIARCLDISRNQHVQDISCEVVGNQVHISVNSPADLSLEQIELQKDSALFSETFGHSVRLRVISGINGD